MVLAQRYITLQLLCTDDLSLLHTILFMRLQTQIQHCLGPTDTEQFALYGHPFIAFCEFTRNSDESLATSRSVTTPNPVRGNRKGNDQRD